MSCDPGRSGLNTSGFNSLYLNWSGCCCSIKRKNPCSRCGACCSDRQPLSRIVQIIIWAALNEKPMDSGLGGVGVIFTPQHWKNVLLVSTKTSKRESFHRDVRLDVCFMSQVLSCCSQT